MTSFNVIYVTQSRILGGQFSNIYDNGENSCTMNQKCKKIDEFALNCGY